MSGVPAWCYSLRPPPLPLPTDGYYNELLYFIQSNASLQESFVAYHNACSDGVIPSIGPKTGSSSTEAVTESMIKEVKSGGDTASAGLIGGLIFLCIVIVIVVVVAALWYWKKKRKGTQQSSKALSMEEYDKTNYLHNNAVKKKSWSSSSVEEGGTSPQTNGGTKHETGNGEAVVPSDDRVKKLKRKETSDKGAINESFMIDELGRNEPESPGIKSIKSDTPLIDSVDGKMVLPNQTIPDSKNQSVLESGDKKTYGSTTVSGGNRLPPVETRPKKSPKKKRRSLVDSRKSAPCPQTEALKEDLAENRNSV